MWPFVWTACRFGGTGLAAMMLLLNGESLGLCAGTGGHTNYSTKETRAEGERSFGSALSD
jgi:hypothetical protein